MNNSENVNIKIIRYLFGIMGPIDEYKQQTIYKKAFNVFIFLLGYLFISTLVMMILSFEFSWDTMFNITYVSNFVALILGILYLNFSFKRLKLVQVEVYDDQEFNYWKKFAVKFSLAYSIWGAILLVIFEAVVMVLANMSLYTSSNIKFLIGLLIYDVVGSTISGLINYRKLKKQIIRKDN